QIPVISMNFNGMEKNAGFRLSFSLLADAIQGLVFGDLLMRCLYRVRPYEIEPGSANALCRQWQQRCIDLLTSGSSIPRYRKMCREIVESFDAFPIDETL